MNRTLLFGWLALLTCLVSRSTQAQPSTAPATRPLIVSAVVGELIDAQEKATYGLFPYYAADNFVEARFEQGVAPDSSVLLRTQLRDGRIVLRPFSAAELAAVRTTINTRQKEISQLPSNLASTSTLTDSIGRRFRVILRTGTAFDGELTARRPTQLEFLTLDLGVVQVERANIARLEELTSSVARHPANWMDIGNGNRLFFQPTARNLRRDEGSLQFISIFLVGANYGITNNISVGTIVSLVPGLALDEQLFALTPKLSGRISDKFYAGGGVLYLRGGGDNAGIFYGNTTYGSADNNLTFGLGYGFLSGDVENSPVVQLGGQTRISRRISLISENYILTSRNSGMAGLYGAKINWTRSSLGLGAFYVYEYGQDEYSNGYYNSRPRLTSSYIFPVYIDFTFRFGKGSR
ncbi:hypothetical protein [uncultured Hymenobacter sp.]|uniref:hypothetical protein n=1 Tax=uncultured Hymenobacter sp. TaxID=170016 RepID=UPI0035C98EB5